MKRAFTLVELLIVVIIVAVLAAIAIPRVSNSAKRSKEASLRSHLRIVRTAVDRFFASTGGFPERLSKLDDTVSGVSNSIIYLASGQWGTYSGSDAPGPFLDGIVGFKVVASHRQADGTTAGGSYATPIDPVSGTPFIYGFANGRCFVRSSASGNDSNGIAFNSY
jgi:prepilin-type N-terminal cleavage/methylation domain-containing protein